MESSATFYTGGDYAKLNPTWDVADSPYKADQVIRAIERHGLRPSTVCEVGCGAGEVLRQLHDRLPPDVSYSGWEIAPEAHRLSLARESERLSFRLGDFLEEDDGDYDLLLVLDVVEHVDDYMGFLRSLRDRARHHIFYIPLDLNAEFALRSWPLVSARRTVGHINSFTKDLALAALEEAGYEPRDHFYAPWLLDLSDRGTSKTALRRLATRALWRVNPDLCARALSGFSLVVLAGPRQQ